MRVRVLFVAVFLCVAMLLQQRGGNAQSSATPAPGPVDVGGYPPFTGDPVVWDDPIDIPEPPLPDYPEEDPFDDLPEPPLLPLPDFPEEVSVVGTTTEDSDYDIFSIDNAVGTRAATSSAPTVPVAIALPGALPLFFPAATDSFANLRISIRTPTTMGRAPSSAVTNPSFGQASQREAIGDMDGDGVEDVVRLSSKAVLVSLGKPSGGFGAATSYSLGATGTTVKIADVNGDGKRDLIVGAGSLYLLLGNGDGTFQAPVMLPGVSDVQSIAVADFNGDGQRDLAVTNITASTVSIFLGKGDGTFQAPASYSTGQFPGSMVAIDENQDGTPDIVTFSATQGTISTLLNKGDGTFGPAVTTATPFVNQSGFLAFADLNKDGIPDLVIALQHRNSVALVLGLGDGSFNAPREYATGTYPGSVSIVPTGAGYAIFTLDELTHRPLVFYGAGGRLAAKRIHHLGTARSKFQGIALADLNGDGQLDVVVSDNTGGNVMVSLSSNGVLQPFMTYAVGQGAGAVQTGDLNGDNTPDIVVATSTGITVLLNKGDGTFSPSKNFAAGQNVSALVLSDFNRDGKLDAAVAVQGDMITAAGAGLQIFLGRGDGTFAAPSAVAAGQFQPKALAAADVNGDGVSDLLVATHSTIDFKSGAMVELIGRGDGTFQNPVTLTGGPAGAAPLNVLAADMNGDGKPDAVFTVVTPDLRYQIVVLLANGDGTFRAMPAVDTGSGSGLGPLAAVDLNGDGNLDILNPQCCNLAAATYLLGNGDGTLQPEAEATSGPDPYVAAASVVNGKPYITLAGNQGTILFMGSLATNPDATPSLPVISAVLNGGSNLPGAIAPGEIVLINGSGLGPAGRPVNADLPGSVFPTQVAGTSVSFDGIAAPVLFSSATQVEVAVPYEVSGPSSQVTVTYQGATSAPTIVAVTDANPALLTSDGSGTGQAIAVNPDGKLNNAGRPVAVGSVIVLFATGEGQTSPGGMDGQITSSPGSIPLLPVTATIGGQPATVLDASEAPQQIAGVLQITVQIPDGTIPGSAVPVQIQVGGASNPNGVTIAVAGQP